MISKHIFLVLLLPIFTYGQRPLKINTEGQLDKKDYQKLTRTKGYELISMFDTVSYNPTLIYAVTFKNKRLGLIDINGNEILKNEYDDIVGIGRTNRIVSEYHDHLLLKKDKKWALASIDGNQITKFEYEGLKVEESKSIGVRENKPNARWKIPIERDSIFKASFDCTDYSCKHIYINTKGQQVQFYGRAEEEAYYRKHGNYPKRVKSPGIKDDNFNIPKELGRGMSYKNDLIKITAKRNDKNYHGIYDTLKKKLIIPIEYTGIRIAGKLPYFFVSKSRSSFILDSLGNKVTDLPLRNAYEIGKKKNKAIVARHQNNKLAIFSKSFKPLTEFIYDNISYSNNLIVGRIGRKNHLIDYHGKEIKFKVEYDNIRFKKNEYEDFQESFIYLIKDKKLAIVSEEGKLMSDYEYEEIIHECFVSSGNYSLHEEFNMTANHSNKFIFYKKDGKYGIMNNEYEVFLKNEYNMILESNVVGFVYISKEIKTDSSFKTMWGVYDVLNKKEIIPVQYNARIKNTSTFFLVKEKNKYGLIDKYGNEVFPTVNEKEMEASYIYKGLYCFKRGYNDPFAYMDFTGKIINIEE